MADRYDIESFLIDFKFKLDIFGILFRNDRSKNAHTLAILEITPNDRIKILKQLKIDDYSEGPIAEKLYNNADMWIFGIKVKGYEIYIKISTGLPNSKTICISFHVAEYPMKFPYKK